MDIQEFIVIFPLLVVSILCVWLVVTIIRFLNHH